MSSELVNSLKSWYPRGNIPPEIVLGAASGTMVHLLGQAMKVPSGPGSRDWKIVQNLKSAQVLRARMKGGIYTIFNPLLEEGLFRGIIYQHQKECRTSDSLTEKTKDIAANAALFTICHIHPRLPWHNTAKAIPFIFFSGLSFCALAEATKNLWAPTIAHGVANGLFYRSIAIRH